MLIEATKPRQGIVYFSGFLLTLFYCEIYWNFNRKNEKSKKHHTLIYVLFINYHDYKKYFTSGW